MSSQQYSNPAQSAQNSPQVINNRFCTSCQLGIHCGQCTCCSSHHLSSTRLILSTGAIVALPMDADPDAFRKYAESRIRLAANPKRKQTKRAYTPRPKRNRRASLSFPFDAGMQATATRMDQLAADEQTFVSGIEWDAPEDDVVFANGTPVTIPQSWYTINTGNYTASVDRVTGRVSYREAVK